MNSLLAAILPSTAPQSPRQMLAGQVNPLQSVYSAYPALSHFAGEIAYRQAPQTAAAGRKLEFYGPSESTNPVPGKATVQVFGGHTSTRDIAADLVSHYLARGADPATTATYNQFAASFTPKQQAALHGQYQWAQKNEDEKRPFAQWAQTTGIPAAFRGYAFGQWPAQFNQQYFTPQQRAMLDAVVQRLTAPDRPH